MATLSPQLTEAIIKERLRLGYQPGVIASTDRTIDKIAVSQLKCAAVLIPLIFWKNEWHLVYTRRTEVVEHHKGQVSFPGGGCNSDESSPEQTALREAEEEIGLQSVDVCLLGRLNEVITITGYRVMPVVGVMPWPYNLRLEHAEVERVFTIPMLWLSQQKNWRIQSYIPGGTLVNISVISYDTYEGEVLWGASAKITQNFLSILNYFHE
jgi:8-oxo-dGTP pyrophosphatase MutT (NUDIX family)